MSASCSPTKPTTPVSRTILNFSPWSLSSSYRKIAGQFVRAFHVLKIFGIRFLGVRWSLETKIVRCDFTPGLPVSDLDAVLWRLIHLLLVMTYRHGYRRAPCAIQIRQSTSFVQNTGDNSIRCRRSRRCQGPLHGSHRPSTRRTHSVIGDQRRKQATVKLVPQNIELAVRLCPVFLPERKHSRPNPRSTASCRRRPSRHWQNRLRAMRGFCQVG